MNLEPSPLGVNEKVQPVYNKGAYWHPDCDAILNRPPPPPPPVVKEVPKPAPPPPELHPINEMDIDSLLAPLVMAPPPPKHGPPCFGCKAPIDDVSLCPAIKNLVLHPYGLDLMLHCACLLEQQDIGRKCKSNFIFRSLFTLINFLLPFHLFLWGLLNLEPCLNRTTTSKQWARTIIPIVSSAPSVSNH